jgi:hypothetical protein
LTLTLTGVRNDCAGEDQQQFNRPTEASQSDCRDSLQAGQTSPSQAATPGGDMHSNTELVLRQLPASMDMNTEAEEGTSFEAGATQPVETQQTEKN